MITVLCLTAMLLSCFCSLVLKKQEMALLLVLFAFEFIFNYNKEMPIYLYLIPSFCGFLSVADNGIKNRAFWFLLFWFAIYYCIIIIFGPYSKPILGWIIKIFSLIFLFLWTMLIKWDRKKILFIVVSYGSYLLAWGFLEKLIFNPPRVGGPLNSATGYAIILCILWCIWFVDSCKQKKNLLFLIFPTGLVLLAIVFSGTRMGIIGLCIGVLFGIYSYTFTTSQASAMSKSAKFFAILFLTSIIFLVIWNTFMKDLLIARAVESILAGKIDRSNMGRITAWLCAYDTFSHNKIWGAGPYTFSDFYSKFLKTIPNIGMSRKILPHAHNEILQILSELGLIGFMHLSVIVSFCIFSIINYMRKNKEETICYGIIAGFFVFFVLIFLDGIPSFGLIPWIMGLMASYFAREKICPQK